MEHSHPTAIRNLAKRNAAELHLIRTHGGDAIARHRAQLQEFQLERKALSGKEYTAQFKNYTAWLMAFANQSVNPSQPLAEVTEIGAAEIKDEDVIYRPRSEPMSPIERDEHIKKVKANARKAAEEVAALQLAGGNAEKRKKELQLAAFNFSLDEGLTDTEQDLDFAIFMEAFNASLQTHLTTKRQEASALEARCRRLCEENWKSFLTFAAAGSADLGKETLLRFEQRMAEEARAMPGGGVQFLATIERERTKLFDEYTTNPEALKRRLGVVSASGGVNRTVIHAASPRSDGNGLGDLAVRTAVRATVWETVISLFRWFR